MSYTDSYESDIPDAALFETDRATKRDALAANVDLRAQAIELVVAADKHSYGYQWEWCGVPIIRHPDDIVLQQEIVWDLKPTRIIETGIARGGSLMLSSTLMDMYSNESKVLGLDIKIFGHALEALSEKITQGKIEIHEGDSVSEEARHRIKTFLANSLAPVLVVLDSNHSHSHVLGELESIGAMIPSGSIVIVADTIISEMPANYYKDRPWDKNQNPLTAVDEFLATNPGFYKSTRWGRRSLMGECRDGIIVKG